MKVLVAIPAYNEEEQLNYVIQEVKKNISVAFKLLVINDGSSDKTLEVAKKSGVDFILSSSINHGLAEVFNSTKQFFIENNFDYLVFFDADLQYPPEFIELLLEAIIQKDSNIVIGERDFNKNNIFTLNKKILQRIGSFVVSKISGTTIRDVTSGFRIYDRSALSAIEITDSYTYTIESILQAKTKKIKISSLKLDYFNKTRQSRLVRSNSHYIKNALKTMGNYFFTYNMLFIKQLTLLSSLTISLISFSRFFIPYFENGSNPGNVQSLILGSFIIVSSLSLLILMNLRINYFKMLRIERKLTHKQHSLD
jgi:glycosyltransferase involved in cell wall biosynthesis